MNLVEIKMLGVQAFRDGESSRMWKHKELDLVMLQQAWGEGREAYREYQQAFHEAYCLAHQAEFLDDMGWKEMPVQIALAKIEADYNARKAPV